MRNGFGLFLRSASWSVRLSARSSICLICLVSVLVLPAWSAPSEDLEPDWPELMRALNEIDSGLQMTEQPLSEIGSYFKSESDRLQQEKAELQNETERLQREKNSLDERERELNGREQGLQERESLYSDMQMDLDAANKAKWRGRVLALIIAGVASWAGYKIGRLNR